VVHVLCACCTDDGCEVGARERHSPPPRTRDASAEFAREATEGDDGGGRARA
jgi:hypothetical protein